MLSRTQACRNRKRVADSRDLFGTAIAIIIASLSTFLALASNIGAQETDPVTRARRPDFQRRDVEGIFFDNIFEDELTGARPENLGGGKAMTASDDETRAAMGAESDTKSDSGKSKAKWSQLITAAAIEDEVKTINNRLGKSLTTSRKFAAGGSKDVRLDYSMLAMLFAIITEYDGEIRWQKVSMDARDAFAKCAAAASSTSETSFRLAKTRRDDLAEILRGGSPAIDAAEESENDWSQICDRTPLMIRLKTSYSDILKPGTSSAGEFRKQRDAILLEANLVAAMGAVLGSEGMEDAIEDDYVAYAVAMTRAAVDLKQAIDLDDFEKAGKAVGRIDQACNNCHGDWQ